MNRTRYYLTTLLLIGMISTPAMSQNTYQVNSSADPGDGTCDTTECTLREAINDANAHVGADSIVFFITESLPPGFVAYGILLGSALPPITDPVVIDGYTQPETAEATDTSPAVLKVVIDGTNAGSGASGLVVRADDSVIRGLSIVLFDADGIRLENVLGAVVAGNHIGVGPLAQLRGGNGVDGVVLQNTHSSLIGGTHPGDRNVISEQTFDGIFLTDESSFNLIQGNYIGTDGTGLLDYGNADDGVHIQSGSSNIIGGLEPNAGNLISANGRGVHVDGGLNFVEGNYIGLDMTGTSGLGNTGSGVQIHSFAEGGEVTQNVISDNGFGVIADAPNIKVQGNVIGLDASGDAGLGNDSLGVWIGAFGVGVLVGGKGEGEGNVISDNGEDVGFGFGIRVDGQDSTIEGNLIGTDATGMHAHGNTVFGIWVRAGADRARIGSPGAGNIISGNGVLGLEILAHNVIVEGNKIGTDISGTQPMGHAFGAIGISDGASGTIVGGVADGAGNILAFNGQFGVALNPQAGVGNSIRGNAIFANGIGIDHNFDGVTANDDGDADEGPNRLQNYPVLSSVSAGGGLQVSVEFVISSDPANADYPINVDFYLADDAGNEGQVYLGSVEYNDASASVVASFVPKVNVSDGDLVVATATDAAGNTSEFSSALASVGGTVGVANEILDEVPSDYALTQAYPNPFNPETQFLLTLAETQLATVAVYDMLGRRMALLHHGLLAGGIPHEFRIEAAGWPSGLYLYRASGPGFQLSRTVMLLK